MTRTQEIRALLLELLRHAEPPRWTGPGPGDSLLEEGDAWAEYVKQWVREQRARIDALVPEETEMWEPFPTTIDSAFALTQEQIANVFAANMPLQRSIGYTLTIPMASIVREDRDLEHGLLRLEIRSTAPPPPADERNDG